MKIRVVEEVLGANAKAAAANRARFGRKDLLVVNLMSAPGAGKTTLIEKTIERLASEARIGVIEGDIATTLDGDRLDRMGVPVVQLTTGSACHLDAHMLAQGLTDIPLDQLSLLFVENVGNLVCPAEFDLGEDLKVMLLSAAEGDDKPAKYPLMVRESHLCLVNKVDLIPYTNFDLAVAISRARTVNPKIEILTLSCRTGEGLDRWTAWLVERMRSKRDGRPAPLATGAP